MTKMTAFKQSVVGLLEGDPGCSVTVTLGSFFNMELIFHSVAGQGLPFPVGINVNRASSCKPVDLRWLMQLRGSYAPSCCALYVSVHDRVPEKQAIDAVLEGVLQFILSAEKKAIDERLQPLPVQEIGVLVIGEDGKGKSADPWEFLEELEARRFKMRQDRVKGHLIHDWSGKLRVLRGSSIYYVRKRPLDLCLDRAVIFFPGMSGGSRVARGVRQVKRNRREVAQAV